MPIFRNYNVPCCYFGKFPVNFKIVQCHLSNIRNTLCSVGYIFLMSIGLMLPVDFKKMLCRPVKFKGEGPHIQLG